MPVPYSTALTLDWIASERPVIYEKFPGSANGKLLPFFAASGIGTLRSGREHDRAALPEPRPIPRKSQARPAKPTYFPYDTTELEAQGLRYARRPPGGA